MLCGCVQSRTNGHQYLLQMSPDKVTGKAGDFGNHMGLELNYVGISELLSCRHFASLTFNPCYLHKLVLQLLIAALYCLLRCKLMTFGESGFIWLCPLLLCPLTFALKMLVLSLDMCMFDFHSGMHNS